jgi:hypothetical protein
MAIRTGDRPVLHPLNDGSREMLTATAMSRTSRRGDIFQFFKEGRLSKKMGFQDTGNFPICRAESHGKSAGVQARRFPFPDLLHYDRRTLINGKPIIPHAALG